MSIKKEEDLLFEELKNCSPEIVCDGIVDEKSFLSARYRIVYILKEVNGGKNWDLRDFVYDGGRAQTWDNIARWTEGILSWEKDFLWEDMQKNNENRRKEELKKIAVVNLKKTSGGHTADEKEIHSAACLNSEILKKQIGLYGADFIILCGTESSFIASCYQGKDVNWKMTKRGVWYFIDDETVIISFSHPEARVEDNYLFYSLIDAVKEINYKQPADENVEMIRQENETDRTVVHKI